MRRKTRNCNPQPKARCSECLKQRPRNAPGRLSARRRSRAEYGWVEQLEARRTYNPEVAGSNPAPAIYRRCPVDRIPNNNGGHI